MTNTTIERNYRKNPHTAKWLMAFHTGGQGLPADIETDADDLLNEVPVEAPAYQPTPGQKNFMVDLIRQITELDAETGRSAAEYTGRMTDNARWTRENVSTWIERMIGKRQELRKAAAQVPAPQATPEVPDGRYAISEDGELKFFKVKNGRKAGFVFLDIQASDEWHSIRNLGRIRAVLAEIAKDPREAMLRYGREIGECGHCGRTLTDAASRAAGIGPICAAK